MPIQFPEHKCSLYLTHNQHRAYYQKLEEYEARMKSCDNADNMDPVEFGWVSHEQRRKAIATDNIWELQWYPDTPVGSYHLPACDLDVLLAAALVHKSERDSYESRKAYKATQDAKEGGSA